MIQQKGAPTEADALAHGHVNDRRGKLSQQFGLVAVEDMEQAGWIGTGRATSSNCNDLTRQGRAGIPDGSGLAISIRLALSLEWRSTPPKSSELFHHWRRAGA